MTNLESLRAKCKLICDTCYVDRDVLEVTLADNGLNANDTATAGDSTINKCAILIVKGWVETSRSEGGVSVAIDREAVKKSLSFWCGQWGLDEELVDDSKSVIYSGSNLW